MKVIKKDGRLQDFNIRKIMVSIERASDDVKESMNESDAENIGTAVMRELNKLGIDKIESSKLKNIIMKAINELGFANIAEAYSKGNKE